LRHVAPTNSPSQASSALSRSSPLPRADVLMLSPVAATHESPLAKPAERSHRSRQRAA
jgi:hypothetical protein